MSSVSPELRKNRADDKSISIGLVANMDGHRGDVVCLAFGEQDGILVSGARDNDMKVGNTNNDRGSAPAGLAGLGLIRVGDAGGGGVGGGGRGAGLVQESHCSLLSCPQ